MNMLFRTIVVLLIFTFPALSQTTSLRDIKIDYSYVGYKASEHAIPMVPVKIILKPSGNDDTQLLQAAIERVSQLAPDASGFRGSILLTEGRFLISGAININTSGIVLRGSGKNTVLVATGLERRSLITISTTEPITPSGTVEHIENEMIKAGEQSLRLRNIAGFKAGDQILVRRPSTKEWISSLGMDTLKGVFPDLRFRWTPGSRDLSWYRTIKSVDPKNNELVLDAPVTTELNQRFGGGTVVKINPDSWIENIGIENLAIESSYNRENPKDEEHCWFGVTFDKVQDSWIRDVSGKFLASSLAYVKNYARKITVQNCSSEHPLAEVGGYRRQAFLVEGQQILVQNCRSESGTNDFAIGFCSAGPNVFFNCTAANALGASGSFESWASGVLYENVKIEGAPLKITYDTKRTQESGWTAANSILWNCKATVLEAKGPDSAPNYLVNDKASLFTKQLTSRIGKRAKSIVSARSPVYILTSTNPINFQPSPPATAIAPSSIEENGVKIINGRFVVNQKVLWGGSMNDAWWLGKTIEASALDAGRSITRFVPGKTGAGLTENLDSLAGYLQKNHIPFYSSGPAIWYERRRDEHSITERLDGNVWAAFYEMPWARSGREKAWDGLSKYDVSTYNPWYFRRLRDFSILANKNGFLLYNHLYNNHNLLETASHWADFPWRPANNINKTGLPEPPPLEPKEKVHVANQFYNEKNEELRKLHKAYIFHTLDQLATSPNVIFGLSFQYSGPLAFQRFFQQTVADWEKQKGMKVRLVIATGKEITDSILADPDLGKQIAVIDMRYWHYLPDGSLWAPKAGQNLAFREMHPKEFGDPTSPAQIYRQVREYHDKYPEKALVVWHAGAGQIAALMGGAAQVLTQNPTAGHGQGRNLDQTKFDRFVNRNLSAILMNMQPKDNFMEGNSGWVLADKENNNLLIYSLSGRSIDFNKAIKISEYKAVWFDPKTGNEQNLSVGASQLSSILKPDEKDWLLLLTRKN